MTPSNARPWSVLLGLLASCLATLAAVAAGVDPDVVLRRALTAGLVTAAVVTVLRIVGGSLLRAKSKS